MKEFKDKVAVITGAASGIGFGIAERCAQEQMKVVLSGINQDTLDKAEQKIKATGATILTVRADVSKREDVEALAQKTFDTFGSVHLLVNNAGVGAGSTVWESTWADWEWVMGVNFWGVLHGVKVFTPLMLAQDTEAHIVNVASIAGLLPNHLSSPYMVSKHAVVALSEHLYHGLIEQKAKIGVSVLCPGFVQSRIMDYERNRPSELRNDASDQQITPERETHIEQYREAVAAARSAKEFAGHVFQAIRENQLYVLSHPELNAAVRQRMENILEGRNP
ncbi:MAG TPA: SDR family NAD(P)-dependent oxidoreductase [Anaerolineales bacterium]|nr:SDR family NAD(P)-dependent oxidoreductase [Anaerolineales bacterium]